MGGWASPAAAAGQWTKLRWRLRRFLRGAASTRFPQRRRQRRARPGPQNAPRGESGSSGRGEEESVGKGARGWRTNVRA